MYLDLCETFNELTDEQAGIIIKSIVQYANEISQGNPKEPTGLNGLMSAVFTPFKSHLDRDLEKYKKVVARNISNGKKGGRPKSKTQKNPKKADNDSVNVNVNDNDTNTVGNELPTDSYKLSDTLIDFVKSKHSIKVDARKRKTWADSFDKLSRIDGIPFDKQIKAMAWMIENKDFQYMPVIESGSAFRSKFTQLCNAKTSFAKSNQSYDFDSLPDWQKEIPR